MNSKISGKYLLLDASTSRLQLGLLDADLGKFLAFENSNLGPLENLFALTEKTLGSYELKKDIQGFIFCSGVGSILGIRMVCCAINMWKSLLEKDNKTCKIFSYKNLNFVKKTLSIENKFDDNSLIITPSKMGLYNCMDKNSDEIYELSLDEISAKNKNIFFLAQKKLWQENSFQYQTINYNIENHPNIIIDIITQETNLDAFCVSESIYKKWTPQIFCKDAGLK